MAELTLVLLGAILVSLGWYWGGVTDSRTTAVATAIPALLLTGVTIFTAAAASPAVAVWGLAGLSAVLGGLVAATTNWEIGGDRTLGLYSLFFALASGLAAGALVREAGQLTTAGLGALIVAIVAGLIFISGALIPAVRGFRSFVGWVTLVLGAVVAFLGFAPSLGIQF
jgi:hypothetical protein